MFKIRKSGCYCTNLEQINFRKLLNLLFKHISLINDPKMARIIPIGFPMIFRKKSATLFYVHCVPQEGGRMQGWESKC